MNTLVSKRSWMITAPLVLVTIGFMLLFYLPSRERSRQLEHELASHGILIDTARLVSTQFRPTQQQLDVAKAHVEHWQLGAPGSDSVPATFGHISQLAKQCNVRVLDFDPDPPEKLAHLSRVPMNLVFEGEFSDLFRLIQSMEQMTTKHWMERVSLESPQKSQRLTRCTISLVIFAVDSANSD